MHTTSHSESRRHPLVHGVLEALRVDLIVVPVLLILAAAFWITSLGSQLPYAIISDWALSVWAVVHGLGETTVGFELTLAPTLMTLGVWLLLVAGARRLTVLTGSSLDEIDSDDGPDGDTGGPPFGGGWGPPALALGSFVVAYAGPLLALAIIVADVDVRPAGFGRLVLLLVSAVVVGFVRVRGVADIPGLRAVDEDALGAGARMAGRGLLGLLVLAALIVAAGLVLRWSDVMSVLDAYSAPTAAGIGLLVVQILFAPSILFGSLSWAAGSGVGLGRGQLSSAFVSSSSPVPDVPVLQLLSGDHPGWTVAAPALLVLVGVLAVVLGRVHARTLLDASWVGAGIGAIIIVIVLEVVAVFSTGALGPLGLSDFGPSPLTSAPIITGWVCLGAAIGLGLTRLSRLQYDDETFAEDPFLPDPDRHAVAWDDEDAGDARFDRSTLDRTDAEAPDSVSPKAVASESHDVFESDEASVQDERLGRGGGS